MGVYVGVGARTYILNCVWFTCSMNKQYWLYAKRLAQGTKRSWDAVQ